MAFSPAIESEAKKTADNPKRRQCEARKQLCTLGIGTKSQRALQMKREAEKQRKFDLKQQMRKERHKGHIEMLHNTSMGIDRIKRNLKLDTDDVVGYCRDLILSKIAISIVKGKIGIVPNRNYKDYGQLLQLYDYYRARHREKHYIIGRQNAYS